MNYIQLERQLREIAPAEKYGYLGYLEDPERPIIISPFLGPTFYGKIDYGIGYNCYDISLLVRLLSADAIIVKGKDSKNLWQIHYFCVFDGTIIDGTPLYRFVGEKHSIEDACSESCSFLSCENPVTVVEKDGKKYVLSIGLGIEPNIRPFENGIFSFEIRVKNVDDSLDKFSCEYRIDLQNYRRFFSKSSNPDIAFLEGKNILKRNLPPRHIGFENILAHISELLIHKMAYSKIV